MYPSFSTKLGKACRLPLMWARGAVHWSLDIGEIKIWEVKIEVNVGVVHGNLNESAAYREFILGHKPHRLNISLQI